MQNVVNAILRPQQEGFGGTDFTWNQVIPWWGQGYLGEHLHRIGAKQDGDKSLGELWLRCLPGAGSWQKRPQLAVAINLDSCLGAGTH